MSIYYEIEVKEPSYQREYCGQISASEGGKRSYMIYKGDELIYLSPIYFSL